MNLPPTGDPVGGQSGVGLTVHYQRRVLTADAVQTTLPQISGQADQTLDLHGKKWSASLHNYSKPLHVRLNTVKEKAGASLVSLGVQTVAKTQPRQI